jgi:hypothetical protein
VHHQQALVLFGQAILLRPGGKGNHLLFQRGGILARLAAIVEGRFYGLTALAESFDLDTADMGQLETAFLVIEADFVAEVLQFARKTGCGC